MRTGSPPIPGSPLTYSPQLPMTPQDTAASGGNTEYSGVAGWPAQPKLLPTVIICEARAFQCIQSWIEA
jgi:5'-AMP-activated protein kinase, regulatory beta subunit